MPDCARCKQHVYVTERVFSHGKDWHRHCLRCANDYCNGDLTTGPLVERQGQPFCVRCYREMFSPKPYERSQSSSDVLSTAESN
ncbi:hypothetical protein QR680_010249 [Steinernema hermaphroditum]|uniref:Cysteine-rich protein 1 n=1 Tax=Steinernema hermaphroditum TaxID=289476 RepID=A0AA39INB3_9BILA|nr:hypothetical protein QR680_010249 [Steinernema hermaphroditum]